ncbi:MAG: MarR family transcriptional regulator [Betaproteobacteria bacterium]|nr:MarR family transcriptional regulator [Betaproteobacteria bacterium]
MRRSSVPLPGANNDPLGGSTQSAEAWAATDGQLIWDRPGYLIRRLHQIHVAMFVETVAGGSITPIQYGLLSILANRPNIDQLTIGEELGLDRANVTGILKRLESRRLVSRVVDPANRRRKLCLATSRGIALIRRFDEQMQACQRALLEPLSAPERKLFIELLSRLVQANNEFGRTALRPNGHALQLEAASPASPRRRRPPGRTGASGASG